MTSYCNINNAYNNSNDDLDKLARSINNQKKSLIGAAQQRFTADESNWKNGISGMLSNPEFSYFSAQGNYSQMNPEFNHGNIIDNVKKDAVSSEESLVSSRFSDTDSIYNMSLDSKTLDTYLDLAKNDKHKNKKNSLHELVKVMHREKCDSNSDESTFDHVKHCKKCKDKLIYMIKNIRNEKCNEIEIPDVPHKKRTHRSIFNSFSTLQTKEILVIVLIGVFIVVLLDIFMRSSRRQH
jgi:hypothetical protein